MPHSVISGMRSHKLPSPLLRQYHLYRRSSMANHPDPKRQRYVRQCPDLFHGGSWRYVGRSLSLAENLSIRGFGPYSLYRKMARRYIQIHTGRKQHRTTCRTERLLAYLYRYRRRVGSSRYGRAVFTQADPRPAGTMAPLYRHGACHLL